MRHRVTVLASFIILLLAVQVHAAGPIGHFLVGSMTLDEIKDGNQSAPADLIDALGSPEGKKAFAGGTVGPDICEEASHYGNTADLARGMISDARTKVNAARSSGNSDALNKARANLAFAYGWLSHCGTDLNVHPWVNGIIGDTYRFNDKGQKLSHGAQESQFTAYLRSVIGEGGPKYDTYIPYDFLSKHTGVPAADLKASNLIIRAKAIAEITAADQVTLTDKMIKGWKPIMEGSLSDMTVFLNNPSEMGNWDLDCGRISTIEFHELRALAMKANGGSLPHNWGKKYMDWYQKTKDLLPDQKLDRLKGLIKSTMKGFGGQWKTGWGVVTLSVSGNSVTGSYPWDKGKITGKISADGRTLTGVWLESPSYSPPKDGGKLVFNLSADGNSFTGTWGYGDKSTGGGWNGTRIK